MDSSEGLGLTYAGFEECVARRFGQKTFPVHVTKSFKDSWTLQVNKMYELRCQEPCVLLAGDGSPYPAAKKVDGDALLELVCQEWESRKTLEVEETLAMLRLLNKRDARMSLDQMTHRVF